MLGIMLPTWFLSMWMSNTATAAMMIPILSAILSQMKAVKLSCKCCFQLHAFPLLQKHAHAMYSEIRAVTIKNQMTKKCSYFVICVCACVQNIDCGYTL